MDIKSKAVRRDQRKSQIMIKGSTHQESMCVPNLRVSKYIKQVLTELTEEIESSTGLDYSTLNNRQIDHQERKSVRK